ncbi:MAG: hypothetical protein PHS54_07590 [Clostridia bacterium]|nr:hypothetical protein [Clostridia bacterium]
MILNTDLRAYTNLREAYTNLSKEIPKQKILLGLLKRFSLKKEEYINWCKERKIDENSICFETIDGFFVEECGIYYLNIIRELFHLSPREYYIFAYEGGIAYIKRGEYFSIPITLNGIGLDKEKMIEELNIRIKQYEGEII